MTRSPPLRVALLATLIVLAPVTAGIGATAPTTGADRTAGPSDRSPRLAQSESPTVLNLTVVGRTATNLTIPAGANVTGSVTTDLGLDPSRVRVDRPNGTVEVLATIDAVAVRDALRGAGVETAGAEIREGVSRGTLAEVATALRERVQTAGLARNTSVTVVGDGRLRVRTTAAKRIRSTVVRRGDLALVAGFPAGEDYRRVEVIGAGDIASVGAPRASQGGPVVVPVALTEAGARNFTTTLTDNGFTESANTGDCRYRQNPERPGYCILTVLDGEVIYAASLAPGLADIIRNGEFVNDPRFVLAAANESEARRVALSLRTGPLPAPVRVTGTASADGRVTANGAGASTDADSGADATATSSATPADEGVTPSGTPSTSTGEGGATVAGSEDGTTASGGQPGFGPVLALSALLAVAGLLRRGRQRP